MRKKLYHGDCLEILDKLPANKIDTCITDSPYELGFMNKDWDSAGISFQKETWEKVYRVLKPGALLLAFGGTRTWHRIAVAIEDAGFEIRDTICWLYGQGFPKSYNISKGIDKKAGKEREKGNLRTDGRGKWDLKMDREKGDTGIGHADGSHQTYYETVPATPEAELWEGYGTALKPSFEPIIVAMKPIDGTFVNNALTHNVAGLWIDGGRIPTQEYLGRPKGQEVNAYNRSLYKEKMLGQITSEPDGRWPANTILDEVSAEMLNKQTGILKSGLRKETDNVGNENGDLYNYGIYGNRKAIPAETYGDSGGASRFFYCAKASKKERNMGLDEKNIHATVKPLALMEYLCKLTRTPTGGIVLDPFMGSGTTGMACVNTDRDFIGIELIEEHYIIARKRIEHAQAILKGD